MAALTAAQIAGLRAAGKSVREIAAELGVSTTTVYRWADPAYAARQNASQRRWMRRNPERAQAGRDGYLERAAPRCTRCGRRLMTARARGDPVLCRGCLDAATAERRRRIRQLAKRGASTATIAARLGLPSGTVATDVHVLRGRGELPPARPHGFDPNLEVGLIALYEDGWPLLEIARSLGRHKRTITRRLAQLRARGLVERRGPAPETRPPSAPAGFAARADVAHELGFESTAAMRAREQRIAAQDPDLVALERVTLRGHDGQLAVFYGPELAARLRAGGPRRLRSRRKLTRVRRRG